MISAAIMRLASCLHSGLMQNLEPTRLARIGCAMVAGGCSIKGAFPSGNLSSHLVSSQKDDGGWSDVEETLWCLGYLAAFGDKYEAEISQGKKWLNSVRLPCGAWGKSERDQPRIPITALASALVPDVIDEAGLRWIASQWEADLEGPTQLTYKGGFFLLSQAHERAPVNPALVERTIAYLCGEQQEDGGFGPWKDHPVGADPWSTGVVLWGLSRYSEQVPPGVFDRAVDWLESAQLANGLWSYHYLDDGTSMALIGLSSVLPHLREH